MITQPEDISVPTECSEKLKKSTVGPPFQRIGIDIVEPLSMSTQGNRYIVVATNYATKWPEAKPIPTADFKQVSKFLYEDIIC